MLSLIDLTNFFLMKNHSIQLFIVFCPNSVPIWNRCLKPNTQKIRSECEEDNVAFLFYVLRAFLFFCLCLIALFNCNINVSLFFLSSNFLIKHYWFMWRVRFRIHFKFIFVTNNLSIYNFIYVHTYQLVMGCD